MMRAIATIRYMFSFLDEKEETEIETQVRREEKRKKIHFILRIVEKMKNTFGPIQCLF